MQRKERARDEVKGRDEKRWRWEGGTHASARAPREGVRICGDRQDECVRVCNVPSASINKRRDGKEEIGSR